MAVKEDGAASVGKGGSVAAGVGMDVEKGSIVGTAVFAGVGQGVAEGTMVEPALCEDRVTVAVCVGGGLSVVVAVRVVRSVRFSAWASCPQAVSNKHKHTRRIVVAGAKGGITGAL
jgi:hypothetical protein